MLAVTSYKADYIAACRAQVDAELAAFRALPSGASRDAFAPLFFNTAILALDHFFLHRLRNAEGKDGNPVNEVRMLCNAIKETAGLLARDSQIKLDPGKSVTGIEFGEKIALDEPTFTRLAAAFFDEIAKRYP